MAGTYVSNTDPAIKRLQAKGVTGGASAPSTSASTQAKTAYVSDADPAIRRLRGESVYIADPSVGANATAKKDDEKKTTKSTLPNLGNNGMGGTFLGGWKQPEAKEKKTPTAAEIAAQQKEAEDAAKRLSYLESLDLDEQQKKIDALTVEAKKGSKLNVHAFGAYDPNNLTEAEVALAEAQEDYNLAKSLQYRKKGDAALSELDLGAQRLVDTVAKYNIEARGLRSSDMPTEAERETALKGLLSRGMTMAEIEQLADYRARQINEQEYDAKVRKIEELANNENILGISDMGAILASAKSIPLNLGSGAGYLDLLMQKAHNKQMGYDRPLDYKTGAMSLYGQASAARETVSQGIMDNADTELGGQVGSFLYQTGMSMADSAVVAGLGVLGLGAGGTLLLGGSAATAAAVDAKNRGGSDSQALWSGALAGAAETVFEKVSLDNLLTGKLTKNFVGGEFKKLLADVGVQGAVEGSEELFTAFANHITDRAIMGGSSVYAKSIREYMAAGMTAEEAKAKATADFAAECATSFVGGVLSGGVMGGVANAARYSYGAQGSQETRKAEVGVSGQDATTPLSEAPVGEEAVKDFASAMDKAGATAMTRLYSPEQEPTAYIEGMMKAYNAGKNGADLNTVDGLDAITPAQAEGAYLAGQADAENATAKEPRRGMFKRDKAREKTEDKTEEGNVFDAIVGTKNRRESLGNSLENAESAAYTETTIKEDVTNEQEGNASSSGGYGRASGVLAEGSGGSVQSGAGSTQARGTAQRLRAEEIRAAVEAEGVGKVNTASLGISTGTTRETLQVVPAHIWTDEMRSLSREQEKQGRQVIYFTGEMELRDDGGTFRARGAISSDGKRIWVRADHDTLTVEQIVKHEEFHGRVQKNAKLMEDTASQIVARYGDEELADLVEAYIEKYGFTNVSLDYVLEEILADAYGGIDIFDYLTNYEGATRYSDVVRETVKLSEKEKANPIRGPTEVKASRDPEERRRALRKGEMVNEFREKVNWTEYYQRILSDEYNPDYFDDGETAYMELGGYVLKLEMLRNGEFSVVEIKEDLNYGRSKKNSGASAGVNGAAGVSGEREANRDGRNKMGGRSGEDGARGEAAGGGSEDTARSGEGLATADKVKTSREAEEAIANVGAQYDAETESVAPTRFSRETWAESSYVTDRDKAAKSIAKALGVTEKQAKAYIDDINSIAKMIADDRVRLDYEPSEGRSSFVKNAEYGGSIDFSTLCKKRRLFTGTFSAIQRALPNTALTAEEILEIRSMMIDKDLEATCGLCYVEGSRANMGQYTKEFLRQYAETNPKYLPNMAEMNTADGQEWLRINHPEVYEAYEYFMNHYGRLDPSRKALFASQQKPKMYSLRTAYNGEILDEFKKSGAKVDAKNENGGLRIQSFSDFEIVHLIDMMQVIMDMSNVGLAGQAYTKVPEFAQALGDTGLKINLSLIAKGVDANGNLIFDDREGMPHETAFGLRGQYSKNVGTIIVVFNNEQLLAAMADPRIDFIIPFHRSQWKAELYNAMGLPAGTVDYTNQQSESYIEPVFRESKTGKQVKLRPDNYMPNQYWDFSKSGKENAEAYLKMCAANNRRPKFSKLLKNNGDGSYSLKADGSTDGYWKLLIDFKMYDNNGVGSPQMPVKPTFNMAESRRMLDEYTGGHSSFPVANDVVDEFVAKYKEEHKGAKFSRELDSEGRQLSEAQAEFFKDSQARDDGGHLFRLYHGSSNDAFYTFAPATSKSSFGRYKFGDYNVNYFTTDKQSAESYSSRPYGGKGVLHEGYVNVKRPYRVNNETDVKGRTSFNIKDSDLRKFQISLFDRIFTRWMDAEPIDIEEINSDLMFLGMELRDAGDGWYGLYALGNNSLFGSDRLLYESDDLEDIFWYERSEIEADFIGDADDYYLSTDDVVRLVLAMNKYKPGSNYDGIIIDDVFDSASVFGAAGTDVITIGDENQFKSVDNLNPTENEDIRYSREATYDELREQNTTLQQQVKGYAAAVREAKKQKANAEYWKGQTQRTKQPTVRQEDIDKLAKSLIKRFDGTTQVEDINGELKALAEYIIRDGDGKNELTYRAVKDKAVQIARTIVNSAEVLVNDEAMSDYKAIKKYLRENKIAFDGKGQITDWADFIRRNRGRIIIAKNGTPIDMLWGEMGSRFGYSYFPSGLTSADKMLRLEDVLDDMEPVYDNPFSRDMAEAIEYCANALLDDVLSEAVRQSPPTFADKQAAKMQRIKWREQDKAREALKRVRKDRDKKIAALKEHYKAKESKGRESRKARELREKIDRHVKDLRRQLLQPSDKQHIPEALRQPVANLLAAINMESSFEWDGTRRVPKGTPNAQATKRTEAFNALRTKYKAIADELVVDPDLVGSDGENGLFDDVIALGNKPIASMTSAELETVWQTLRAIESSVRTANKMFAAGRFQTVREAAEELRFDNGGKKAKVEYVGPLDRAHRLVSLDMLTPEAYFHRLGESGDALFKMMRKAQDKYIEIMKAAADFTAKLKSDVKKLEKESHTVTLGGHEVQMTTAQLMELYVLARREQALGHIATGGIMPEAVRKGLKKSRTSDPINGITMEDISKACSLLTAEQVEMAEKMQSYLSNEISDYGNEASMEVYNYKKFTEKNYWPIRTNKNETKSNVEKDTQVTSVANRGFTKAVKPNANTSVMVGSIFDTFSRHTSEMATYAAWLGVTEDINRIRNFQFRDDEGNRTGTVKGLLDRVHGSQGGAYLQKLLSDISLGVRGNELEYMGGLVSNYKAASVGANLRVIIQQPTAILRALDMIDPKYLVGGLKPNHGWQKALKYAPIAQWKDWGYFDINTGRQMKDVLFDNDTVLGKARQISMMGASKMDSLAWGQLWNACELETKAKHKDLKGDALYKEVAKRFGEIVDHTQVVDGVLQRSQIMRSSSGLTKMAVSFMGEPTKQYNMLLSAAYDAKTTADKKAKQRLARSVFAFGVSGVVNAMAQSIMDAIRDDDKEEKYWEKWLQAFTGFEGEEEGFGEHFKAFWNGNLEAIINPTQYIPYAKDVFSLLQGYDVSRMDMESVEKTLDAGKNMLKALSGEGKYTIGMASANLFAEAGRLLGIPIANLKREIFSFAMHAAISSDNYMMQYRMEKATYKMNNNSTAFLDILYQAYANDPDAYKLMYADMVKSGFDAEKIRSGMETRMKKAQSVTSVDDLKSRYLTPTQQTSYDSTMSKVKRSGVWKSATAAQRKEMEGDLYDLTVGNSDGVKLQEKIAGGNPYGVGTTEYLLYELAKDVVDQPNDKGNYGTYTNEETEAAIRMLGLSNEANHFLWMETHTSDKNEPNW